MKLKLTAVVASMSVLGLISCPAFAATTAMPKHKHKHHMAQTHNYKNEGSYKGEGFVQPVMMDACPKTDMYTMIMDEATHNVGRAKPTQNCNNLIAFAGGINFDAKGGNLGQGYNGENNERLSLNDAYINTYGNVNDWVHAFLALDYNNASGSTLSAATSNNNVGNANNLGSANGVRGTRLNGHYSNAYSNPNTLRIEQGFITFGNFDQNPVFVRVGKGFKDYGQYNIHPITRSLAQSLTEINATSADLGFITQNGISGSIYAMDNPVKKSTDAHSKYMMGLALAWDQISDQLGWEIGGGYISSLTAVNDVGNIVGNGINGTTTAGYVGNVGAVELHGHLNSGPYGIAAVYTTALQHFNTANVPSKLVAAATGAKPWAADVQASFSYNAWSKDQTLYVGYQASRDTMALLLPSSRWIAGVGVNMWRNTNIGVEFAHDIAYNATDGGTGENSNTLALRAAVQFG